MAISSGDQPALAFAARITRLLEEGGLAALATVITGPGNVGAKLMVVEGDPGITGGTGNPTLDATVARHMRAFLDTRRETQVFALEDSFPDAGSWPETRVLFELLAPPPHLLICGAGHVGAALARIAELLGYGVTLIDDRAEFVQPSLFPSGKIELVSADGWEEAVHQAAGSGRNVFVAVVTRGHKQDEDCVRAALKSRPEYIGMIGSKRRTRIVLARLQQEGIAEETIQRIRAPIGLDIAAVSPEEVALSILAEIVAVRRGGSGLPLSNRRRGEPESPPRRKG